MKTAYRWTERNVLLECTAKTTGVTAVQEGHMEIQMNLLQHLNVHHALLELTETPIVDEWLKIACHAPQALMGQVLASQVHTAQGFAPMACTPMKTDRATSASARAAPSFTSTGSASSTGHKSKSSGSSRHLLMWRRDQRSWTGFDLKIAMNMNMNLVLLTLQN